MEDKELEDRIVAEVEERMDIVPYTKRDKWWNYAIYFLVITNALSLAIVVVIWGSLW